MREGDDIELTDDERDLAEELTRFGPWLGHVARALHEDPDPAFLLSLRAKLTDIQPTVPAPGVKDRLRKRLVGAWRRTYRPLAGVSVLAAAAVVLFALLRPGITRHGHPSLASGIPSPSTADLIWGFPSGAGGGGGGPVTPTGSRIHVVGGVGYPKRLTLHLSSNTSGPNTLPVSRLAMQPPFSSRLAATARTLGISGRAMCMSPTTGQRTGCGAGAWRVVAQNLFPSRLPLRSLAFSLATGETIYHDTGYDPAAYRAPALGQRRSTKLARQWLAVLGWPADQMPVLGVAPVREIGPPGNGKPLSVQFGWSGGVHATRPAATVWVSPSGKVIEAEVWPPVEGRRVVPTRNPITAFQSVQTGRVPVAVERAPLYPLSSGTGTATRVTIVTVLVVPGHGPLYLVPAYRFSGEVRLSATGQNYRWYALASAVTR